MKKVLALAVLGIAAVGLIYMEGCSPIVEGKIKITGAEAIKDGAGVKVSWDAPEKTTKFNVYFDGKLIGDKVTTEYYEDKKPGKAGEYWVEVAGNENSRDKFSTEPIAVVSKEVYELNGAGVSGIEFSVSGKAINTHSMGSSSSTRDKVDCFFTNFKGKSEGFGTPFSLASPDQCSKDAGNTDPSFTGWKKSAISKALEESDIEKVVLVPEKGYFNYTDVVVNSIYAVETAEGYYGLVMPTNISTTNGKVEFKATFQPVKGLRLF